MVNRAAGLVRRQPRGGPGRISGGVPGPPGVALKGFWGEGGGPGTGSQSGPGPPRGWAEKEKRSPGPGILGSEPGWPDGRCPNSTFGAGIVDTCPGRVRQWKNVAARALLFHKFLICDATRARARESKMQLKPICTTHRLSHYSMRCLQDFLWTPLSVSILINPITKFLKTF